MEKRGIHRPELHPAPASPQTPQTACGDLGYVAVHTVEGWMLALADRGLTGGAGKPTHTDEAIPAIARRSAKRSTPNAGDEG